MDGACCRRGYGCGKFSRAGFSATNRKTSLKTPTNTLCNFYSIGFAFCWLGFDIVATPVALIDVVASPVVGGIVYDLLYALAYLLGLSCIPTMHQWLAGYALFGPARQLMRLPSLQCISPVVPVYASRDVGVVAGGILIGGDVSVVPVYASKNIGTIAVLL